MDILSKFAERLSELIFDTGSTVKQLAEEVPIDISVLRRYLRGETLPSLNYAVLLADRFNCSLDYLFGLSENTETTFKKTLPGFSDSFRKILTEKKISRYKIYTKTSLSEQSVADWYHGKRVPSLENCIKLAHFLDCSLDDLIGRSILR